MNGLARLSPWMPLAASIAFGVPAWQVWTGWGMSPAEFSSQGDATLKASGYAFSIWSPIYLGLAVFAFVHARRARRDPFYRRLTWPAAIAIAGCGVWILASAANARWASVVVIAGSALAAGLAVVRVGHARAVRERWSTFGLALLGGWLLVASTINLATVATAEGWLSPSASPAAAAGAVTVVVGFTLAVLSQGASNLYAAPAAWGLTAVSVAEWERHPSSALIALAGVFGIALIAILTFRRRRRARP